MGVDAFDDALSPEYRPFGAASSKPTLCTRVPQCKLALPSAECAALGVDDLETPETKRKKMALAKDPQNKRRKVEKNTSG